MRYHPRMLEALRSAIRDRRDEMAELLAVPESFTFGIDRRINPRVLA